MATFRGILFLVYQALITPVYAVVMLATFWLPRVPRYRIAAHWCRMSLLGARFICGVRWRVEGLDRLPRTPHVVMSKHSSTWETLALNIWLPPLAFVAKQELLKLPFFGWGFALASPITIDRKAGRDAMEQIVEQGRERFAQGFWIVVYPEGTRIRAGTRGRYKTGGARLATALDVPILPVAHNAGWLWPKGTVAKRAGEITLVFGTPIVSRGKDPAALTAEVETWIEAEVARLGAPA
ncbi:MAG TPA: lysophospholipid acyltransferase family protein [Casimicrobiaceae bacterium]|jgi:1-acyl-sn-glycerol-3-phosphate acyltransferase|nr:lysophospholipid acyltransferase family protein [Casimicrobiaceae bacterium]